MGHWQSNSRESQALHCCSHTTVLQEAYLKELALVEAIKVVFVLAFWAEQEVEEGEPHLPIKLSHLHLVFRGHHVPCAILKLLELA